jgi:hypothetical protein
VERQIQGKGATEPGSAPQLDFAAQEIRKLAADRQAQPCSTVIPASARIRLFKGFEYELLLLGRDADTGIGDLER